MNEDKVEAFKEILVNQPNDAFARYGLAMEYRQRGDARKALEQFNELEKRHPAYTAGYQMAAEVLIDLGEVEQARQRIESGIASARAEGNGRALREMQGMLLEIEEQAQ